MRLEPLFGLKVMRLFKIDPIGQRSLKIPPKYYLSAAEDTWRYLHMGSTEQSIDETLFEQNNLSTANRC